MRQASAEIYTLLRPVVLGLGYELVGIEHLGGHRNSVLRVYIDAPQGITVDDCEKVSRQVSGVLDVSDPIRGQYRLEVSSPGMDRLLFEAAHFERFAGSRVKLQLETQHEGRRRLAGRLAGFRDGRILLQEGERELEFRLDEVAHVRLVPDYES